VLYVLFLVESGNQGSNIDSFLNTLWYSIVTLTTVGYGDYYPVTGAGKVLSLVFVMGSLGILGYLISQINQKIQLIMENKRYGIDGIGFKGHIIIIGQNSFSEQVLGELVSSNSRVIMVGEEKHELDGLIERYANKKNFRVYYCKYDDYAKLSRINIHEAYKVYVSFDDDSQTLVHILNLQSIFKDLSIVVTLQNQHLKDTFKKAGVTFSISRDEIAKNLIASYLFEPHAASIIEDLSSGADIGGELDMQELKIGKENPFNGALYQDAFVDIKKRYNSVLVGLFKPNTGKLFKNPPENLEIDENDGLIILIDSAREEAIMKDFN
jgi:voltage-gated potassium channel